MMTPAASENHYVLQLISADPLLLPYKAHLLRRIEKIRKTEQRLISGNKTLADFSAGHEFFGLHLRSGEWVFREWAPNARKVFLVCEKSDWQDDPFLELKPISQEGVWELRLPVEYLKHGDLYRLHIHWDNGSGNRIPAYARRVIQNPESLIFNAQVWLPPEPYHWQHPRLPASRQPLLIYEVHVGMALEKEGVGTYSEFTEHVLPRIIRSGYNTLQLMAVQEHPYYASFGYQVSNFFAASSRFGTPEELKQLVDTAHGAGLRVIMDLVHSHAAPNTVEGLSLFDGTPYQYFHAGERGEHSGWGSRCFDYGKIQVLHFLLSNCRYWIDEFNFDGFRFDGVTSMLYRHHGLNKNFLSYEDYFDDAVDEDALIYLALANRLIHQVLPEALTIAEDVSGMPLLAVPEPAGGIGFDYRLAMGIPDFWIRLTKDTPDERWPMGHLWFELNNRRKDERSISYAESHDQALVGDQTLFFRMVGAHVYDHMHILDDDPVVDRALSLHKLIRLITLATAGSGYLNFMGNEFGHPEWIDFPREGNHWSYRYARRQWSLADNSDLKYRFLLDFDAAMLSLVKNWPFFSLPPVLLYENNSDKILAFSRGPLFFIFNFNPVHSFPDYPVPCPPGSYRLELDTDKAEFGGQNRIQPAQRYFSTPESATHHLLLYLPTRTALVLGTE